MRILIIGGTRFRGPWVVRRLTKMGHEVTVFDRGLSSPSTPPKTLPWRPIKLNDSTLSASSERNQNHSRQAAKTLRG